MEDALVNSMNRVEEIVKEYGPATADLVLSVVTIQSIANIFASLVVVALGYPVWKLLAYLVKKESEGGYHGEPLWILLIVVVSTLYFILLLLSATVLFDFFEWLSAFGHPEFLLTRDILYNIR